MYVDATPCGPQESHAVGTELWIYVQLHKRKVISEFFQINLLA